MSLDEYEHSEGLHEKAESSRRDWEWLKEMVHDPGISGAIIHFRLSLEKDGLTLEDVGIDQNEFEKNLHLALVQYLKALLDLEVRVFPRESRSIKVVCQLMREYSIRPEEIGSSICEIIDLARNSIAFRSLSMLSSLNDFEKTLPDRNLEGLVGKKVLDLGCGGYAADCPDEQFSPYLCRFLWSIGADPVGIDIKDLRAEKFEHFQVDLSQPNALDFLPGDSFDYVHTRNFVFSNPSPALVEMIGEKGLSSLEKEISRQTSRLLKEGGYFISNDANIYQKNDGELVTL